MKNFIVVFALLGTLIIASLSAVASTIKGESCANVQTEPKLGSAFIACLEPEEQVDIVRRSNSGLIAWVKDERGTLYWLVDIPSRGIRGWVAADRVQQ